MVTCDNGFKFAKGEMNNLACGDETQDCVDSNTEAKQWQTMNQPA